MSKLTDEALKNLKAGASQVQKEGTDAAKNSASIVGLLIVVMIVSFLVAPILTVVAVVLALIGLGFIKGKSNGSGG